MSDEKSQAQKDKESRVKKIEDDAKKVYTDLFDKHQKEAEANRVDEKDNAETKEEYYERIKSVPGLFSDSYAYGNNVEQGEELKEEVEESDAGDDENAAATDEGVADKASAVSPASDNTKPSTAIQNQTKVEEEKPADSSASFGKK